MLMMSRMGVEGEGGDEGRTRNFLAPTLLLSWTIISEMQGARMVS